MRSSSTDPHGGLYMDCNPRYDGVEILNVFADLRLTLSDRGLMQYREDDGTVLGDALYLALNQAESLLRERLDRSDV